MKSVVLLHTLSRLSHPTMESYTAAWLRHSLLGWTVCMRWTYCWRNTRRRFATCGYCGMSVCGVGELWSWQNVRRLGMNAECWSNITLSSFTYLKWRLKLKGSQKVVIGPSDILPHHNILTSMSMSRSFQFHALSSSIIYSVTIPFTVDICDPYIIVVITDPTHP